MAMKQYPARPDHVTVRAAFSVAAPDRAEFRPRVCGFVIAHRAEVEGFAAATAGALDTLHFRIASAPAWPAAVWAELDILVRSLGGIVSRLPAA